MIFFSFLKQVLESRGPKRMPQIFLNPSERLQILFFGGHGWWQIIEAWAIEFHKWLWERNDDTPFIKIGQSWRFQVEKTFFQGSVSLKTKNESENMRTLPKTLENCISEIVLFDNCLSICPNTHIGQMLILAQIIITPKWKSRSWT